MKWHKTLYEEEYDESIPSSDPTTGLKISRCMDYVKGNVLILGCGPGIECESLKKKKINIIASDVACKMVKIAKKRCGKVLVFDATGNYPLKNNEIDTIIAFELIEHLGFIDNMLKECRRVLRRKGRLIISSPSLSYWKNRFLLFLGWDIFSDFHPRLFTPNSLKEKLNGNGFVVEKTIGIGKTKFLISNRFPILSLGGRYLMVAQKKRVIAFYPS